MSGQTDPAIHEDGPAPRGPRRWTYPPFYSFGYYGNGVTKGKVDSRLSSEQFTYLVYGHTFASGL